MLLADSQEALASYFIVTAAAIPAQFIAAEFIQYHGLRPHKPRMIEIFCTLILVGTIAYMYVSNGVILSVIFIAFSVSLIVCATGGYSLRIHYGAERFIASDAILNVVITISVILALNAAGANRASFYMLTATTLCNFAYGFVAIVLCRARHSKPEICSRESSSISAFALQIGILLTTQVERLFIGSAWPMFLGLISIVGAASQAWRRLVLDDSILIERIRQSDTAGLAALPHVSLYTKWALPLYFMAVTGSAMLILFGSQFGDWRLTPAVGQREVLAMMELLGLYIAASPAGIVAINLLRDGRLNPSWRAFLYIALIAIFEVVLLWRLAHDTVLHRHVWMIVMSTASINFVLLMDFIRTSRLTAPRSLWVGAGAYLTIGAFILWTES